MTQSAEPQGLGGWLIVWSVWVGLVSAVLLLSGLGMVVHAFGLDGAPRRVADIMALKVEAFAVIAVAVLGIAVLWLHVTRSKRARLASCAWLLAVAAYQLYTILQHGFSSMALPTMIIAAVSIGGLAYFLRSRRVRNTFVR